ncbi:MULTISPECIES: Hsp20/alpha crystallin family protein [unclassified Sedimentibacter]|uniref:Hsp20/alpha crystallin family protein n=1 Tax=unclassified Sedimentibacter TaxID=2649220 RepID=UPI0027E0764E|nr:Hsp20/alpha crystallin family protein [Sedimentibacter sp. MB35-C1]WMJ78909.1 Hsp20/alpha crystallin family protein [Sedimentibacter sp. MB35-C1]
MSGLVPFNRKNRSLMSKDFDDFGNFYNMVDDFFNFNWPSGKNFIKDTFKVDVQEDDKKYLIEAELPGVSKDEVNIEMDDGKLSINVKKEENVNEEKKNYIHRERRYSSMSRCIYLEDAKSQDIKAGLDNGVLKIAVPKESRPNKSVKIDIE